MQLSGAFARLLLLASPVSLQPLWELHDDPDRKCPRLDCFVDGLIFFVREYGGPDNIPAEVRRSVQCLAQLQVLMQEVCESLFDQEAVQLAMKLVPVPAAIWGQTVSKHAANAARTLRSWLLKAPTCRSPGSNMITDQLLDDFSSHLQTLAAWATPDPRSALKWLSAFSSGWAAAGYYLGCLQYLSLQAYGAGVAMIMELHAQEDRSDWPFWVHQAPSFRFVRNRPLKHNMPSSFPIVEILRRDMVPGRRIRFAEIGVFMANLSQHVWKRIGRQRGSLEMHLVDHWGAAMSPVQGRSELGTGSDMAGASNSSLLRSIERGFVRQGARCLQVPYWISGRAARESLATQRDVFFHRTYSVNAAKSFEDESLDLVFIDADHKWWSVLQDLVAWWPKVRRGGVMMGHDFHLDTLMEREEDSGGGGNSNDVPVTVFSFFRAPLEITIHSGFVWSVLKPAGEQTYLPQDKICKLLRSKMAPHWEFEVCDD